MPIVVYVLLAVAILLGVAVAYAAVNRTRRDQRRRARWLSGDDR